MRRFKQQIPEAEAYAIVKEVSWGVLGINGEEGYPLTFAVHHVLKENKLYFHSAKSGYKIDAINVNPKVSFLVVDKDDVISREYTTYFRSVMIFGKAHIVKDEEEKESALHMIAEKFASADLDRYEELMEKEAKNTSVICIDIEHITGKEAIELAKQR